MILVSLENVEKYSHMVARLPQRLKSMLFEIFLNGGCPKGTWSVEKISNNVDFSLWGNLATTWENFLTFSSETKIMKIRHSAYPRLDCNNTGCSERVQRCMYTNIAGSSPSWIRSVIVICDFDGWWYVEYVSKKIMPLSFIFLNSLYVIWFSACILGSHIIQDF